MNQATVPDLTFPKTMKLTSVTKPTDTFFVDDLSYPGYFTIRTNCRQGGAPVCDRLWPSGREKPVTDRRSVSTGMKYPGYDLNHPGIDTMNYFSVYKGQPVYKAGYKHGAAHFKGAMNLVLMDGHVENRTRTQTNNVVFKWH
jgi:hypothetical protein